MEYLSMAYYSSPDRGSQRFVLHFEIHFSNLQALTRASNYFPVLYQASSVLLLLYNYYYSDLQIDWIVEVVPPLGTPPP